MKLFLLLSILATSPLFAQEAFQISKSTQVIYHDEYQDFYSNGYQFAQEVLANDLKDYGCILNINFNPIKKPSIFRKGSFSGSFDLSCIDQRVSDVNLFLEVYPRDEHVWTKAEISFASGQSKTIYYCLDTYDGLYKCPKSIQNAAFNFL